MLGITYLQYVNFYIQSFFLHLQKKKKNFVSILSLYIYILYIFYNPH